MLQTIDFSQVKPTFIKLLGVDCYNFIELDLLELWDDMTKCKITAYKNPYERTLILNRAFVLYLILYEFNYQVGLLDNDGYLNFRNNEKYEELKADFLDSYDADSEEIFTIRSSLCILHGDYELTAKLYIMAKELSNRRKYNTYEKHELYEYILANSCPPDKEELYFWERGKTFIIGGISDNIKEFSSIPY